ncbi:gp53-like domain-containing protein, partial [Yersinia enterocolitica]
AGGLPPKGQDMNQILYELSSLARWTSAGALNVFDSTFSASISGYPKGAVLSNSTFTGCWLNTTDANTVNPENTDGSLTGWVPAFTYGTTAVTGLAATNVTLTALQAANERITLTGVLTANINLIFPAWRKEWAVVNNCTGAFSVTCKTPSGTGVSVASGGSVRIIGDGTNITSNESPLITGALQKSANLSDLANIATALSNLGIGAAGLLGVATNAQMAAGTSTSLLPTVAAVMSLFSKRTFTTNDYIRIPDVPGGLIIQWCGGVTTTTGDSSQVVTFPIPFPNLLCHLAVTTIAGSQSVSDAWFQQLAATASNCTVVAQYQSGGNVSGGVTPRVLAIGY